MPDSLAASASFSTPLGSFRSTHSLMSFVFTESRSIILCTVCINSSVDARKKECGHEFA